MPVADEEMVCRDKASLYVSFLYDQGDRSTTPGTMQDVLESRLQPNTDAFGLAQIGVDLVATLPTRLPLHSVTLESLLTRQEEGNKAQELISQQGIAIVQNALSTATLEAVKMEADAVIARADAALAARGIDVGNQDFRFKEISSRQSLCVCVCVCVCVHVCVHVCSPFSAQLAIPRADLTAPLCSSSDAPQSSGLICCSIPPCVHRCTRWARRHPGDALWRVYLARTSRFKCACSSVLFVCMVCVCACVCVCLSLSLSLSVSLCLSLSLSLCLCVSVCVGSVTLTLQTCLPPLLRPLWCTRAQVQRSKPGTQMDPMWARRQTGLERKQSGYSEFARRHTETQTHTHRHRHTDTQRHTHTHRYTHTQTHRHTQTHTDTHTDTHRHTDTDALTQTHSHRRTHTDALTQTHTHTDAHTQTHSHRCTHAHPLASALCVYSGHDAAYALCVFVPLVQFSRARGFTQFWPGSHKYSGLLGS